MKLLGISGSYRSGTTEYYLGEALQAAREENEQLETELLQLRKFTIEDCNHCNYCVRKKANCCIRDDMDVLMEKFVQADGYLLASPVYTYNPTPLILRFFNRMRPLRNIYDDVLFGHIGGAMAVGGTRNGGQEATVNALINCLLSRNIAVVGGSAGNYTGGTIWVDNNGPGGADQDEMGLRSSRDMGVQLGRFLSLLHRNSSEGGMP